MPTVQIPITVDTFIRGDIYNAWNAGAHPQLVVGVGFTALVKPDLSSVPAGSTITSASLSAYVTYENTGVQTVSVHRLLKAWGEGNKHDEDATAGEANWTYAEYDTAAWDTAGAKGAADRAATASSSLSVDASLTGWRTFSGLAADVQAWLDGDEDEYGWGLYGTSDDYAIFSSSDGSNAPVLTVVYEGLDSTRRYEPVDYPLVTVTPVGGSERPLKLEGHPQYSVARGIGYEAASIPVAYDDLSSPDLQGAQVRIHSSGWRGIVIKKPVPGEPLIVMGKGAWVGSLKRTSALYSDHRLHAWREWRDEASDSGAIRPAVTPSSSAWWIGLTKGEQPYQPDAWRDATSRGSGISDPATTASGLWLGLTNGTAASGAAGVQFYDPENGISRIQATWSKAANTNFGLVVYRGTAEGVVSATPYAYDTGTGGSIDLSLPAGTVWAAVCLAVSPEWTPNAAGLGILVSSLAVNSSHVWYRRAGIDYYDERGISNVSFQWDKPATTSYGLMVLRGDSEGVIAGTPLALQTGTGAYVDLALPAGTVWVAIALATNAFSTPNLSAQGIAVYNIDIRGRDLPAVNSLTVTNDIIDTDIDAPYGLTPVQVYPFIEHSPWVLSPLMFDSTTMNEKFATLMERAPIEYGWYEGRHWDSEAFPPDAFPHVWDRSRDPAYLIALSSCEEPPRIEMAALDEMTSGVIVRYQRVDGTDTSLTVPDTDPTHPLVALGIVRYGEVTIETTDDLEAAAIAAAYNTAHGRWRVRGSVTVRSLVTITGGAADRHRVRPGEYMRLTGTDAGAVDVRIERITYEGALMTLEFDGGEYRLDRMLAHLRARR